MKFLKIAAALISAVFLGGCIDISVTDYEPDVTEKEILTDSFLTERQLYDRLTEEMKKGNLFIELDGVADDELLASVCREIEHDFPEYYWMNYNRYIATTNCESTVSFHGADAYDSNEILNKLSQTEAAADEIISAMPSGLDDYEKILYVHDYIANNTVYAKDKIGVEEMGTWDGAYGCLVLGEAVCGGYSAGFSYLMKKLGIECGVVTGDVADENGETIGHAWNYVMVNHKYYWLDVTWNDTDDEDNSVLHTYFLIDDLRMNKNRVLKKEQYFVPSCFSMDDNFCVRNKAYITVYNPEAVGEAMAVAPTAGKIELMFANKQAYDNAFTGLLDNGELWTLTEYDEVSDSIKYVTNDNMYALCILY